MKRLTYLLLSLGIALGAPQKAVGDILTPHGYGYSQSTEKPRTVKYGASRSKSSNMARPRAWCGWYMRTLYGGGPEYNLARNWARRGSPSGPHVGAIVVWPHHVGVIVGQNAKGQWLVKSGNDGGKVRTRVWNLRGAQFRSL
jgi:hypothetical protein